MSYISHEDYKDLMSKFQAGTPKAILKEAVEEGNAFTAALAKTPKGAKAKVGGKEIKDTSNYDAKLEGYNDQYEGAWPFREDAEEKPHRSATGRGMRESHPENETWFNDFQDAIKRMDMTHATHRYVMKALDHVDPMKDYGDMEAASAAKEFVSDLVDEFRQNSKDAWLEKEGLHMPPLQATGQVIDTVEENSIIDAPFGVAQPGTKKQLGGPGLQLSNLNTDERKQLGEFVDAIKTTKKAIEELLKKASGKDMKVKEDMGGDRTDMVMTPSTMSEDKMDSKEYEFVENHLDMKLHDAFETVTDKIIKNLKAEGVDEDLIEMFLKHEIEKIAQEAIMGQHD
jgi:hypothetical protein